MKQSMIIVACGIAVCVLILAIASVWGIWLPDVIKPKAILLDQILMPEGDRLRLTQLWVGDGYATEFFHTDNTGQIWIFAIDGDAKKAWKGKLRKTNDLLSIRVLNAEFYYDTQSHVVTSRDGTPQMVEEIPRGTPIIPPR